MKTLLPLTLLASLLISCSHTEKKSSPDSIHFVTNEKEFSGEVKLPEMKEGKVPLVVIVHEWWGRNEYMQKRSDMLNKEGFATLAVDLYGNNQVVSTPAEAQALATPYYQAPQAGVGLLINYIEAAKLNPKIDANQVFVIGYCFGGTQALNLARSGYDIKGVASFHGGLIPGIAAQNVKAKVLAVNGLADPMVPPKERQAFDREMKAIKANFKVVNYANATHAFSNPDATETGKKFNIPVAYDEKADKGSWNDLLTFLRSK